MLFGSNSYSHQILKFSFFSSNKGALVQSKKILYLCSMAENFFAELIIK